MFNRRELKDDNNKIGTELDFVTTEAYNLLATNVDFSFPDKKGCKVIGITSSCPQEGKSYTSVNLAYTIAQTKKVLLIDGDLRKATIADILSLKGTKGVTDFIVDGKKSVVKKGVLTPNLSVITAGSPSPRPIEILSSESMKGTIEKFKTEYDYILIDFPPINIVSDVLSLADVMDGALYVVRHGFSKKKEVIEGINKLKFSKMNILGIVYNDYYQKSSYGYRYKSGKYNYKYDYYKKKENKEVEK